jgi:hypothetical protein
MKKILGVLLILSVGSCQAGPSPADVATYEAIAPEYRAYVTADPALGNEEKTRRFTTLETWRLRVGK